MPATVNRPGGVNTAYGYDGANRLTSVHHDGPAGALAHFDYTLDANGNRTAVASAAGTESYTLDVLNRLTGVSYPNGDAAAYTYDPAGNRLSSTLNGATTSYTYDSAGRLTAAGASSLTYDAAGNVTSNGSSSFSWDWAGRVASATIGGTTSTYTYDGDSTRVAATSGTSTTNYIWDRVASLPLLIDDGTQGYVQTDQGLLEQLGAAASFPLNDALGSVRSVVSPAASVLGTASYDAFGSVRSQTGQSSIFGFTGQQTDPTGLSYLRARYYNPISGRFLSPDRVQPNAPGTQGFNAYTYADGNPSTVSDPSGQFGLDTAAIGRAFSAPVGFSLNLLAAVLRARIYAQIITLLIIQAAVVGSVLADLLIPPSATTVTPQAPAMPATGAAAAATTTAAVAAAVDSATTAVRACEAAGTAFKDKCPGLKTNVYLPGYDAVKTTGHIIGAIATHPLWGHLTYGTNSSNPGWYAGDSRCLGNGPLIWCDEYPFFSTKEGGKAGGTSLLLVPMGEQVIQRTTLSAFYRSVKCGMVKDDPTRGAFLVIPGLTPITTWFCKG